MAEAIVKIVLGKITDAAVKEVLQIWGLEEQVERVRRELDWIQVFLKDADRKQILDEMQKRWVREVREVAFRIEDAIDTFLCEVPQIKPSKRETVMRMFQKTKKLPVILKLGDEINQILTRLQEISDRKERFGIKSLGEGSEGAKRLPVRPPVLPDIEDPDIVGLDVDRDNIIKELLDVDRDNKEWLDKATPRRSVVSIVGQGGLGKTTLAKKVYNSIKVKREFGVRIWVTISQEFVLIDVLKKIISNIGTINDSEQGKDEEYFLTRLSQSLQFNYYKYLLILDDVWSTDLWMAIEKALPNNYGSRILMTTRIYEVAKEADPAREPYKLGFLTEQRSLELFLKKAIPNRETQNECSNDLLNLAIQFVKKCGGLPLALVVLGGLLAKKQHSYSAWSKVLETMNWHANEQKRCTEIISTSYDDLPLALKSCFMYFAVFPEDYDINTKSLLQMWIAEGFIPHEENRTLEHTAESFLEDLIQRSMVQVSRTSTSYFRDDSIEQCRIHDMLRDVAIEKAKEDNFVTVCSTLERAQSCGPARRVAVHNLHCREFMKYVSPNLRTLFCYNTNLPNCSGHRLLKVLWASAEYIDVKCIEESSHLRYLRLEGEAINWDKRSPDKLIGSMKFLQTLDLSSWYVEQKHFRNVPDCMWHIKTLRHVWLSYTSNDLGAPPATDLPNLQTLKEVKSHTSWARTKLPNLPNLRELQIEIIEGFQWEVAAAFLHTLKKLVSLYIKGRNISTEVVDMQKFPFYQHLTSLCFNGRLSCKGLDVTMFPTHLVSLCLYDSDLKSDPMPVVEKLQGLKSLTLIEAYSKQTMRCSAGGFPRLRELTIWGFKELQKWEIEKGAMPVLKNLVIRSCPKLQVPQGLQHLTTLKELTWDLGYMESRGKEAVLKAKKIRNICKHVPSITILACLRSGPDSWL